MSCFYTVVWFLFIFYSKALESWCFSSCDFILNLTDWSPDTFNRIKYLCPFPVFCEAILKCSNPDLPRIKTSYIGIWLHFFPFNPKASILLFISPEFKMILYNALSIRKTQIFLVSTVFLGFWILSFMVDKKQLY